MFLRVQVLKATKESAPSRLVTWCEHTWCVTVCGSRPPGGQGRAGEHLLTAQPLCYLAGRDGVLEVLPPGQGGTQQAQSFTGAGWTLQNPIRLLKQTGTHGTFLCWTAALKVFV